MTASGIKTINKIAKIASVAVAAACSAAVSSMVKTRLGVKAIEDEINEGVKALLPFKKDAQDETPRYMEEMSDEELMSDY